MNTICRCNPDPNACENKPRFVRMDLDEKVESYFLHIVYEACQCYTDPVDLCTAIKQCLDQKFGPMWHVVVGPVFGRLVLCVFVWGYFVISFYGGEEVKV